MIKGFKMKLFPGMEEEYEKRHNQLWQEMKDMIHEHGGKNYTIFLDRETMTLFGYIEIEDEELWAKGADTAINRKWWDFMADIMETNPDNSPVRIFRRYFIWIDAHAEGIAGKIKGNYRRGAGDFKWGTSCKKRALYFRTGFTVDS